SRSSVITLFLSLATPSSAIFALSLRDALPISAGRGTGVGDAGARAGVPHRLRALRPARRVPPPLAPGLARGTGRRPRHAPPVARSEEHTSELQSRENLVCRLLLEKKKT